MASLTGVEIANSYQQLLQVGSNNIGLTTLLQYVQDGSGNNSALQLSNSTVNIDGLFQLNGVTLTATASVLNAVADLTGANGIIAVSAGQVYGRTLVAGGGLSITNATGTAGNPTFSLNTTGVSAGSYGPVLNMQVNQYGQVTSVGIPSSVSIATIRSDDFVGGTLALSSNASVTGTLHVVGGVALDGTVSAGGNLVVAGNISGNNITVSTVSAAYFYGDGSHLTNLPSAPTSVSAFTITDLTVVNRATFNGNVSAVAYYGDGSHLTNIAVPTSVASFTINTLTVVSGATINGPVSGTSGVFSGIVSAANFVGGGAGLTNVSAVFAASATNATNAVSAAFAASATNATNAVSAAFAASATNATTAVNATNVTGSGIVSAASGVFTGTVSVNEIDASIGSFNGAVSVGGAINVVGAVSGTSAVFTGVVSVSILDAVNGDFSGIVSVNGPSYFVSAVRAGSQGGTARPAFEAVRMGYSSSYRALIVGSDSTTYTTANTGAVTLAFNVDPSLNAGSQFNGQGGEFITRRGVTWLVGNAANTAWQQSYEVSAASFHKWYTDGGLQFQANETAGSTRAITVTGSNGGSPTLGTTAGGLNIAPTTALVSVSGGIAVTGAVSGTSAVFTGVVSVNEIDASIGSFSGAVSVGGSLTVSGLVTPRVVVITDAVSITVNADTTDIATQANTQIAGTLTVNAPTGTPVNGQKLIIRLRSTNVQTFSWDAAFVGSTDLALPTASSGSSKYDYVGFMYNSTALKWQLLAKVFGF